MGDAMNAINLGLIEAVSAELVDMLGEDFDAETFWDSLDGETDAMDIIGRILRERAEAQAFEVSLKAVAADYTSRAQRYAERSRAMNKALGSILDATRQKKVTHLLGTVSRTAGRSGVHITDEASVPTQLCKIVRAPDKAAIKAALDAGEEIPGAELRVGDPGVTVRVK